MVPPPITITELRFQIAVTLAVVVNDGRSFSDRKIRLITALNKIAFFWWKFLLDFSWGLVLTDSGFFFLYFIKNAHYAIQQII